MDTRTALLVLASALLAGLVRALKSDLTAFPTLSTPIRGALAIVGGALVAGIDAAQQKSAPFLTTTLVALATSAPTLATLLFEMIGGGKGPGAGASGDSAPKPASPTASDLQGGQHPLVARLGVFACVAVLTLLAPGCGATIPQIVQTAQTATIVVQTVLNVLSQLVASYYAIKPDPAKEAHLHDLLADVASADAALQRATSGTDKVLGGDIAVAYANLDKAYTDLMVALTDSGILKKIMGSGASGFAIALGKHADEAVPPLPKLKGAS